ncbi:MAG TPA: acyl-CoA reductase [Polyangiaceae bacterium]|nr:acyl-CoA reductase [Polyangiaceae bacterium]
MPESEPRARVERLLAAARRLADPHDAAGRALRKRLLTTTRLSEPNIELGVSRCLETTATESELESLLGSTPPAPSAHVLLSGNVFVAALRGIALGLAASAQVHVRASRRDPALAEALHALEPELFRLESELSPRAGDRYFAYGSDETLLELRQKLPRGVWFHPHGSGFGAVVVDASPPEPSDFAAIGLDTVLFDQRGCLSPRVVLVAGNESAARRVATSLASELTALERALPPGPRSAEEAAAERRAHDAAAYAFELLEAGRGWVSLGATFQLPPASRCLHVAFAPDPLALLAPFAAQLTTVGTHGKSYTAELARLAPHARVAALGSMQRPALDGPVDRRASPSGELLR